MAFNAERWGAVGGKKAEAIKCFPFVLLVLVGLVIYIVELSVKCLQVE